MKIEEYIRLGSCAICPFSSKKEEEALICHWDEDKRPQECSNIKECGHFPALSLDLTALEIG